MHLDTLGTHSIPRGEGLDCWNSRKDQSKLGVCICGPHVDIVNQYGGRIEGARRVGDDQLQTAVRKGIRKANFDTDIKLIFTATARERLAQYPNEFDPKSHLDIAEARLVEYVKNRNKVLFAAGKTSP